MLPVKFLLLELVVIKKGAKELNLATSDEIKRQPGSTAKPLFDYGPLIEYNNASTYGYNDNGNYKMFVDEPYSYTMVNQLITGMEPLWEL